MAERLPDFVMEALVKNADPNVPTKECIRMAQEALTRIYKSEDA